MRRKIGGKEEENGSRRRKETGKREEEEKHNIKHISLRREGLSIIFCCFPPPSVP